MKKFRSYIYEILLFAAVVTFGALQSFAEGGILKSIVNVISLIVAIYTAVIIIWRRKPWVIRMNNILRKLSIFRILLGPPEVESIGASGYKTKMLNYTIEQYEKRLRLITAVDLYTTDFTLDIVFKGGSEPTNKVSDWKSNIKEHHFSVITGESGCGKSFELIKRVAYLCGQMNEGRVSSSVLEREQIPLYVELRTLDQVLDKEWLIQYIYKSGNLRSINGDQRQEKLKEAYIREFIEKGDIVYFFDGLDEVNIVYRKDTFQAIIDYTQKYGVTVTCRKEVYDELANELGLKPDHLPGEFHMMPLSEDRMLEIVNSLESPTSAQKEEMKHYVRKKASGNDQLNPLSRPMFFNLFIKFFNELSEEKKIRFQNANPEESLHILWEYYEDQIAPSKLLPDDDVLGIRTYTVWLAKIMKNQSFYVESIQPFWLSKIDKNGDIQPAVLLQKLYYLVTRVLASMIIGVSLACIISTPFALLSNSVLGGVIITIIAGVYKARKSWFRMRSLWANVLFSVAMLVALVSLCGFYQGLSVPRAQQDMLNTYYSGTESWSGVLLGLILCSVFTYRIILEKINDKYILPVEKYHFNWRYAILYGLFAGFICGVVVGGIGLYVKLGAENSMFINSWLIPHLKQLCLQMLNIRLENKNINIAIFLYGFLVSFSVSSLLIMILAGRYKDEPEDVGAKQKLNYGIKASLRHALRQSVVVAIIVAIIYMGVTVTMNMGNALHGVKISVGVALASFVWFGGMEVINHVVLRINLYIRGIAPLNYDTWVQANQNMALIRPSGFQMAFYHRTLETYYLNYPLKNNPRLRLKENRKRDFFYYGMAVLLFIGLLMAPLLIRYTWKLYWKDHYGFTISRRDQQRAKLIPEGEGTYNISQVGTMRLSAEGHIKVGTFVGWSFPYGTHHGFMGMPIDSAYNLPELKSFRHAALLMRSATPGQPWSDYHYVSSGYFSRDTTIRVVAGERLQFIVNDKEFENNLGRYRLHIRYCDTCK